MRPVGQRDMAMTEATRVDAQLDILLRSMASVEISAVVTELDGEIEMMATPTNFDVILLVSLFMDIFCTSQPLEATDTVRTAESVVQPMAPNSVVLEPSEVAGSIDGVELSCWRPCQLRPLSGLQSPSWRSRARLLAQLIRGFSKVANPC